VECEVWSVKCGVWESVERTRNAVCVEVIGGQN
jgi:hypothetical protein